MKKALLIMVILGLALGCATTKDSMKDKDITKWTDEELMQMHERLDPTTGVVGLMFGAGVIGVAADATLKATKHEQRQAIRQELEARGYEYHPERKDGAFGYSGYHPEWEKKQD